MKTRLLWILLALATATQAATLPPSVPQVLVPLQQQARAANLTAQIFTRYHYKPTPLDNAMS
jgi:carboxyl-terminal processing protease